MRYVHLQSRPSIEAQTRQVEQLRAKLLAAETLCEELMDENEDMKKELRDLEEEIEEMQDNFRFALFIFEKSKNLIKRISKQ